MHAGTFLGYESNRYIANSRNFWNEVIIGYGSSIFPLISDYEVLGDTNFTRFYMTLRNKSPKRVRKYVADIKRLWQNRTLIIVEGEYSRLGVGNDLFDNCASIRRILCPSKNAFGSYNAIYQAVAKHASRTDLIIIALGMTATVLACDLSENGFQAIDIGHIDIEYEWFRKGATKKVAIENKYTNEADKNLPLCESSDAIYLSQIIDRIR